MAKLIELSKRKAELEFKKSVYDVDCEGELKFISSTLDGITERTKQTGVELITPRQNKLDEMNQRLSAFSPQELKEGLEKKSGEAYEALNEKGIVVKENYKNRVEIAKLCVIAAKLNPGEKELVSNTIKSGILSDRINVSSLEGNDRKKLARVLRRCGINCISHEDELIPEEEIEEKEVRVELPNRSVWIIESMKGRLDENLEKIEEMNRKIQLLNAERYVKEFSEEEEKNFEELQAEYLGLLKEQDEMLKEFNEEEKITISI